MQSQGTSGILQLPADSFSDETRQWIADQINKQYEVSNFTFRDIIRVPNEKGQFELYGLRRAINQGSRSVIYRAYHLTFDDGEIKGDQAPVAVKCIPAKLESARDQEELDKAIQGLERESRALKLLNRGGGRVDTREGAYLIMPLYFGVPLGTKVPGEKGKREKTVLVDYVANATLENKLLLMLELGLQLQDFHDKQFLHGDFHPANILIANKDGQIFLRVIDFDQSRPIGNKEELIDEATVSMAIQIRAPEVFQKKIGAPSDIHALARTFLCLLGHENPFASEPDKAFIRKTRDVYQGTPEYDTAFKALQHQVKPDLMKQLSLFNQKYPMEEIEKLYIEQHCKIEVGNLTILPEEIGGIPVRLLVTNFIKKMLHDSPEQRPTIDEVNAFMRGVIYLVQQKVDLKAELKTELETTSDPLEGYKKIILELGKPAVVIKVAEEKKEEKVNASESDLADREQSQRKLKRILYNMNNIENVINRLKGLDPSKKKIKKSKERKKLEISIRAIASLFNADSANPAHDCAVIMRFLEKEKQALTDSAGMLESHKNKLMILDAIISVAKSVPAPQETLTTSQTENRSPKAS